MNTSTRLKKHKKTCQHRAAYKDAGPAAWEPIIGLLRRAGVPFAFRCPCFTWGYNGKTIALYNTIDNVIHDAAHYLVCPDERRHLPDFGLGPSPDSGENAKIVVSRREANTEEELASILGIALEHHFGRDIEGTLCYHGWLDYEASSGYMSRMLSVDTFWRRLEELRMLHFLDDNLQLTLGDQ